MWLKGDKTAPAFHYAIVGEGKLSDEVTYLKKGKTKSIKGTDYQDKADSLQFVWKGKGLLRVLKSRWRIALMDPEGQWVVICFSKTLFTPAGADIISRSKQLPQSTLEVIKTQMRKDPVLKEQVETLKELSR